MNKYRIDLKSGQTFTIKANGYAFSPFLNVNHHYDNNIGFERTGITYANNTDYTDIRKGKALFYQANVGFWLFYVVDDGIEFLDTYLPVENTAAITILS